MKIAVISDTLLPTPMPGGHGLGRMAHQIASGLRDRGHQVTLYAKPGSKFRGALVTPKDATGVRGERVLAKVVYQENILGRADAVIDNSHMHLLSSSFPSLPVLNVYHDIFQPEAPNPVVVSEGGKSLTQNSRIHAAPVVHNAVDPDDFEFGQQGDGYALYMGAITEIKQPVLAVAACALAGIRLKMAGYIENGQSFALSGYEDVEYVGPVSGERRAKLLSHASVFLQLGYCESFGLTTLEAGLSGVPVVAWPMGGNVDTVRNGVNGRFVPATGNRAQAVADSIRAALLMPRAACREYVLSTFSIERQIDEYEQLAERVARGERW